MPNQTIKLTTYECPECGQTIFIVETDLTHTPLCFCKGGLKSYKLSKSSKEIPKKEEKIGISYQKFIQTCTEHLEKPDTKNKIEISLLVDFAEKHKDTAAYNVKTILGDTYLICGKGIQGFAINTNKTRYQPKGGGSIAGKEQVHTH